MTQPQYGYAPQQGGYQTYDPNQQQYPQQAPQGYGYAPQGPAYAPPPNQYQQQVPNGYQSYGQQQPPQQPPQPQGAKGSLEDFYGQPSQGAGKGLTWNQVPNGYTYVGVVQRTPTDGDLFQDSDPKSGQLKTWKDGSPKFVLPVQLRIHHLDQMQQMTYPEGDARMFLRGGLRDELNRAMAEAGDSGVPKQGALVIVTLTHRKPGQNIATNVYEVHYYPEGVWEQSFSQYVYLKPSHSGQPQTQQQYPTPQQAPAQQYPQAGAPQNTQQAPYEQQAPAPGSVPYAAPAQAAPAPQQYAQPQYGQQAYDPNSAPVQGNPEVYAPNPQAPVNQGPAPYQPAAQPQNTQQAPVQEQLPYAQPQQAPAGQPPVQAGVQPSGLDSAKQALLARITGQPGVQGQ